MVTNSCIADRFANGAVYEGDWHNGKKNGHGVFSYPDDSQYDGKTFFMYTFCF